VPKSPTISAAQMAQETTFGAAGAAVHIDGISYLGGSERAGAGFFGGGRRVGLGGVYRLLGFGADRAPGSLASARDRLEGLGWLGVEFRGGREAPCWAFRPLSRSHTPRAR
jgi:hypothetical protein